MKKWITLSILLILFIAFWVSIQPSNDRNWAKDQTLLPYIIQEGNYIQVYNIRNFTYRSTSDYDIRYYNATFDLNALDSLWYVVEPFSEWKGAAHTFLSFGFGEQFLAVSIEIRKEIGEEFSSWKGLLKKYEIMYVLADEQDVIKLRTNYRKDEVFLYPANTTKAKMDQLLLDMLKRTNELRENPEFYNTLTDTCTTNIVKHINTISPNKIPFSLKIFAPGYSDRLAYDLGLIQTDLSFDKAREYFQINDRAERFGNDTHFSARIREFGT